VQPARLSANQGYVVELVGPLDTGVAVEGPSKLVDSVGDVDWLVQVEPSYRDEAARVLS